MHLPSKAKKGVADIIADFETEHMRRLNMMLLAEFGNAVQPDTRFREFQADVNDLAIYFKGHDLPPRVAAGGTPIFQSLKAIILERRLLLAERIEAAKTKSSNIETSASLDAQLFPYDMLLSSGELRDIEPNRIPRLSDYLTLERMEELSRKEGPERPREYDEKFHILQAPRQFLTDLAHYRTKCQMRRVPLSVAFLDIDKFKQFNTELGETRVDKVVLPPFMTALESQVFGHGYAYRYGGDEYGLLLPNSDRVWTAALLKRLQARMKHLKYDGTKLRTHVSIGFCVAGATCPLSNMELINKAERAKNFAKENGRDCIASYTKESFAEADRAIVE
jgi:diguanylate cyclase (GGDEF)-like protein